MRHGRAAAKNTLIYYTLELRFAQVLSMKFHK